MIARMGHLYRAVAVIVLGALLLGAVLEAAAAVALRFVARPPVSPEMTSPYFARQPWGPDYVREIDRLFSRLHYHPYVVWRARPFEGRLVRVSPSGRRVHPGPPCPPGAPRVWVFGGSTVWGLGSPDDQTIPFHLQARLGSTPPAPCVENLGQLGYVSSQSVVELVSLLREGGRADRVVFYDGVNDTVAGFVYRQPGIHLAYDEIRQRVEAPRIDATPPRSTDLLAWSSVYRLVTRLLPRRTAPAADAHSDALVDGVVTTYLENVRLVKSLATTYGFRPAFFWQPTLATGAKPLNDAERAIQASEGTIPFARRVYARFVARTAGVADVHDLTGALDRERGLAYLDWHHTTPEANATIARAIAEVVATR